MFGGRKYQPVGSRQYDSETGGRSSPRNGRRGSGSSWKKYAIIGGAALGLVLFLGSNRIGGGSARSDELEEFDDNYHEETTPGLETWPINETPASYDEVTPVTPPKDNDYDAPDLDDNEEVVPTEPSAQKDQTKIKTGGKVPSTIARPPTLIPGIPDGPTSPETDPDPTKTTYCTVPFKGKKLVQYALMIDAGSTGSRIHVYKFNYCSASPMLEYEVFMQVRPGLSSFPDSPAHAAGSLNPLMDEAVRVVPESLRKCTPLAVKATAGLRMLGATQSDAILKEVEHHLKGDFPFPLVSHEPVVIMDGKDEGVYAWITANYLLNKIGEGSTSTDTLAVMDLGGASTQIVFEPTFTNDTELAAGDHKYELTFGGREFVLYQHSYLGYGLMQARRSVHNLVAFAWSFSKASTIWETMDATTKIANPCLGAGRSKRVELDPPGRTKVNVTMVGGNGGWEACKRVVELVMAKDAICEVKPCSFNGVYQPSLLDTFPKGTFLALSYFYDRIRPLFAVSEPETSPFDLNFVKGLAQTVCAGEDVWRKVYADNPEALKELEDREEYCLDLTFMHALLGLGYEIGRDRELMVGKQLRDVELGWALGAGLAMLDGKLKCLQ